MPRPTLSLYRRREIVHQHRVLLLSVVGRSRGEVRRLCQLPGLTGIVVEASQNGWVTRSIPQLILCPIVDFWDKDDAFFREWLKRMKFSGMSGVVLLVPFGGDDEVEMVAFAHRAVGWAKKSKMETVLAIDWQGKAVSVNVRAYSLFRASQSEADYICSEIDEHFPVGQLPKFIGRVELICGIDRWPATQSRQTARRMVAEGARGLWIQAAESPIDEVRPLVESLAEAVFGPGNMPGRQ